jgi:RHS repeat-associated protein
MGKSGASSNAISPPAGSGKVAGMGEAFSLDLNSGQGTYNLSFELPDGVAGFRPTIRLEYSHGQSNGPFGLGWKLQLRQIDRRLDFGVPGEAVTERILDSDTELRQSPDGSYHPVREMAFSHYERVDNHWVITEKDGSRYFLGITPSGRIADPGNAGRIQSWLLERQEDVNGNAINYFYDTEDGYPYLKKISYSKFSVRFSYETRPDVVINGRAGFIRSIKKRCNAISLFIAAGDRKVRTLSLNYENAPYSNVSLLTSSRLTAHGNGQPDVVKNPVKYEYSSFDPQKFNIRWIKSGEGDPEPPPLSDPETALIAMDDLPLPGIITNRSGRQYYWPNNGNGGWSCPRVLQKTPFITSFENEGVQFVDMDGNGSADMLAGIGINPLHGFYRNNGSEGFGNFSAYPRQARTLPPFQTGRVRMADLNGDGVIDAIYSTRRGFASYINNGQKGWAESTVATNATKADFADPLTFMADMTGDGLPDTVRVRSGLVEYWPNLGYGRFGGRVVMMNSPRLPGISDASEQLLLSDIDGDGCCDLIRISAKGAELYVNQSGRGFASPVVYPVIPIPIPGTVRAVDMYGQGKAGLLYNTFRGGKTVYVYFSFSDEIPPYLISRIDNGTGLVSEIEYSPLINMALKDLKEGRIWDTYMPFPLWLVSATRETDTIRGRTSEVHYRYHDGHFDPLLRRFHGFRNVDKTETGDESRPDTLVKYTFLMNQAALPGKSREHAHLDRLLEKVAVFSLDGTPEQDLPYHTEETEYGLKHLEILPDGSRVFVFIRNTWKCYLERTDDERVEQRTFDYDAFGNVTREITRGYGIENGTPAPEKEVLTEVSYATDSQNIIFKIKQVVKRDTSGKIIMEMRRYYDGLPYGQLSRGLMTREEHLVLPAADFNVHYAGMDMAANGYFSQSDADGNNAVFALEIKKTYTTHGNIETEETGAGRITQKIYDDENLYVTEEIVNGKRSSRTNEPVTGKPLVMTAYSGTTVRISYDAFGRTTALMLAGDTPGNPTRAITYDDINIPNASHISYRIDDNTRSRTVNYLDGTGKEVQKRVERKQDEFVVSSWMEHNPWKQVKAEFEPTLDDKMDFSIPDTAGRPARRIFFDGEGRPVRVINYNGAESSVEFTPFEITTYDAHDKDNAHTGFNTPRRERVDVWNHRTEIKESVSGGPDMTTYYSAGLFGELLELSDANGTICNYGYDFRGNRLSVDHRDAGLRLQWFDSHNDIIRTRDANGNDVTVERDSEGRITVVKLNGSVVERFSYDDVTPAADGRLVNAQYSSGSQQFSYSQRGFLKDHTINAGGHDFTFGYEYNDMGRQTAVTYPDGTRQSRGYTLNGLIERIDGIIDKIDYDARNLPVRIEFANDVITTIDYEPGVGHVRKQRTVAANGTVMEDVTFTFDELMQITGRSDSAPGVQQNISYKYDDLNQLKQVSGSDATGNYTLGYSYSNGYNLSKTDESKWYLGYNDAVRPDRLSDITRPGEAVFNINYDANGNMKNMPGREFNFNFKNQLEQVTLDDGAVVKYDYDYRGNRVRRSVTRNGSTTDTIFLGRLTEFRAGQYTNFVILNRRRIAIVNNGRKRWIHTDPTGSANFFSDENGTKISQIAYHPYGSERSRAGTPAIRTFALHDYDDEIGLIYMGYRWYSPEAGRFITPDPLYLHRPERSDGDPGRLRLYTYAGNSPLDNVDPAGLSFWSVVGAIVGVIVGIVVAIAVVAAFAVGIGWGLLAIAGVIGLITVSYIVAHETQGTGIGEFFRGFMIGINAGMNGAFLAMMGPVGAFLGGFVGTLIFLSAFDTVAGNHIYQGILGWSNWLMPMSWLVTGLGLIMWILNGLGHLLLWEIPNLWGSGVEFCRITGFRMDWSTGMLATRGGWVANANTIDTAYNMGNFAYVDNNSSGWHLDHEAGHNLSLAVFGSIFHFVGFIHEMGTGAGSSAFAEVMADSNDGGPGMWAETS